MTAALPTAESAEAFALGHIDQAMKAITPLLKSEHVAEVRNLLTVMDAAAYMTGMNDGFQAATDMATRAAR